jgi:small subunit ribosomal protein S6
METNNYEAAVIFTPVLSETQLKEAVKTYRELITANKGTIVNEESWGLTKLAYNIQKKSSGFYHFFEFNVSPDFIKAFDIQLRRDERVLRFINLKLDKHALLYNERRKNGEFSKAKKAQKQTATT